MPTGTIKKFDTERGFGFIRPDENLPELPSTDLFVHITACRDLRRDLYKDDRVEFTVVPGRDSGKFKAANVRIIDAPGAPVKYGAP